MKEYAPYLVHQIARFGALSTKQMLTLCQGRCKRSTLYRTLGQIVKERLVLRITHPVKPLFGYVATPQLYPVVYGVDHRRHSGPRAKELEHSFLCADVMITLSRYSAVTGLATEHECDPDDLKKFCHERIPDGIIQITQGDLAYELAVEIENCLKSHHDIDLLLSNYQQTLLRNMPCVGLLIVACDSGIYSKYQKKLAELPPEIENRILLTTPEGLKSLNPKYYGVMNDVPGPALEKLRHESQGRGNYISMKSGGYENPQCA